MLKSDNYSVIGSPERAWQSRKLTFNGSPRALGARDDDSIAFYKYHIFLSIAQVI